MGRSLQHLVTTVNELQARGVEFQSVQQKIDTTTPGGRLVFHVFAAMAKQKISTKQTCGLMGISRATYFRYLKAAT